MRQVTASSEAECLAELGVSEAKLISVEERIDRYSDETRAIKEGLPLATVFEKTVTIVTMESL